MATRFQIEASGGGSKIDTAVACANAITELSEFYERIRTKYESFDPRWTSPGATPEVIAQLLQEARVEVRVLVRKARRKVLGWTYASEPGRVYLNARRLERTATSIVATLVHEWVHCVDAASVHEFHHGSNKPAGKEHSAPYWIDRLAAEIAGRFFLGEDLEASLTQAHALQDEDELLEGMNWADVHLLDETSDTALT